MRKTILSCLIAAMCISLRVQAKIAIPVVNNLPKNTFGVKVGANFEQLNGDSWEKAYKPGFTIGIFGGIHKNRWGVKAEALVNTSQYTIKDSIVKGTFRALSLAIPVLVEYKVAPRIWLQVGPQFGSILSMKSDNDLVNEPKKFFKTSSFNLVGGVEARLPVHLIAGARYIMGLTDIQNQNAGLAQDAWKQRSIQLYLGFRFI